MRYVIICLASCSTLLPLVKMICPFVGLVYPLVVLICPFIIIVFSFVYSLVLRVCPLVVLVWPLIGPLVFLAVLSVGLFFYNWSMHFDVFFSQNSYWFYNFFGYSTIQWRWLGKLNMFLQPCCYVCYPAILSYNYFWKMVLEKLLVHFYGNNIWVSKEMI